MLRGASAQQAAARLAFRRRRARRAVSDRPLAPTTLMEIFQIIGGGLALAGALAAVVNFWITRNDMRVERTLHFVERFDSDALLAAQKDIAAISAKAQVTLEDGDKDSSLAQLPADELESLRARVIVAAAYSQADGGSADLASSVGQVVGFFDGLSICVKQHACDSATAHAFFDNYATAFWRTFTPVIEYERANRRPGFGREMEAFVKRGDSR